MRLEVPRLHALIFIGRLDAPELAGLAPLDRLVHTAAAAGCRRVHLAGARAAEAFSRLQERTRAAVAVAPVGPAEEAAGVVDDLAREPRVLVLHGDVAIDPRSLRTFLDRAAAARGVGAVVAVREGPAPRHPAAATLTMAGRPAHTVGLAVVPGEAAAVVAPAEDGATPLFAQLAREHESGAVALQAVHGALPCLVDDAGRAAVEAALVRAAGKETDGFVSRLFNRRISGAVTRLLLAGRVAPNTITFALLGLGVLTGLILLEGSHAAVVVGTLLYQINSTLDGCDGEIARVRFETSRFGAWADTLSDQVTNLAFFVALPLGLYRRTGDPVHFALAVLIVAGVVTLLGAVYVKSRRIGDEAHFSDYGRSIARAFAPGSFAARAIATVSTFLRRDSYALLFFVLALAGADAFIVYLIAAGVLVHFASIALPARGRQELDA